MQGQRWAGSVPCRGQMWAGGVGGGRGGPDRGRGLGVGPGGPGTGAGGRSRKWAGAEGWSWGPESGGEPGSAGWGQRQSWRSGSFAVFTGGRGHGRCTAHRYLHVRRPQQQVPQRAVVVGGEDMVLGVHHVQPQGPQVPRLQALAAVVSGLKEVPGHRTHRKGRVRRQHLPGSGSLQHVPAAVGRPSWAVPGSEAGTQSNSLHPGVFPT